MQCTKVESKITDITNLATGAALKVILMAEGTLIMMDDNIF